MEPALDTSALKRQLRQQRDDALSRTQMSVEDLCLLILALRNDRDVQHQRSLDRLLSLQNRDGSWPSFSGGETDGCWVTALALTALLATRSTTPAVPAAIAWLKRARGKEAGWFWQWKFRTIDTNVQFDPSAYGWSWVPDTTSWVIPTAFTLIALEQSRIIDPVLPGDLRERIDTGVRMLLDRACPGGGWNAGNRAAFGVPYSPYLDATAIALLALTGRERQPLIQASLAWLMARLPECPSPYSLAWGILALTSFRNDRPDVADRIRTASGRLVALLQRHVAADAASTLAVSVLALEAAGAGRNVFEVPA